MAKGYKTGGRKVGSLNKITANVKEAFGEAFELLGGAKGLYEWGLRNKTEFYKLSTKLIPIDANLNVTETPEARVYPKQPVDESGLSPTSEAMDSVH